MPAFLLYFTAVDSFSTLVTGILEGLCTLHRQSLDISTVRECLDYPELFRFKDGLTLNQGAKNNYEIVLENVSFRYPGAETDTLKNINLTLHPGENLAVVGLNGAGKTTLIKIICGFLDPTKGQVKLNGTDIRNYNRKDYYKLFSAVFQDFHVSGNHCRKCGANRKFDLKQVKNCIKKSRLASKNRSSSR